ncbi:MAG: hypothetical protein ACOC53_05335 [Candidatus Saliniplasma sp.]
MARKKKGGWYGDKKGHRYAAMGKKVPWAKRHKQKPGPAPQLSKEDVQQIHGARTKIAQAIDEAIQAETVLDIEDPADRAKWARNPSKYDLEGLDTVIEEMAEELRKEKGKIEALNKLKEEVKKDADPEQVETIQKKLDIEEKRAVGVALKMNKYDQKRREKLRDIQETKEIKNKAKTLMRNTSIDNYMEAKGLVQRWINAQEDYGDKIKDFDQIDWNQVAAARSEDDLNPYGAMTGQLEKELTPRSMFGQKEHRVETRRAGDPEPDYTRDYYEKYEEQWQKYKEQHKATA